jgi:hypothetical protein
MYVYVSWAYTDVAENADIVRQEWIQKATKSEGMTEEENQFVANLALERCAPEYADFLTTLPTTSYDFFTLPLDKINRNLLAVRFVVPSLGKLASFQLSKRMPGSDKQLVSAAARAFLLNTFTGEWTGRLSPSNSDRVTFVGFPGLNQFLSNLALACGALDNPLPIDCWMKTKQIELSREDDVRQLMTACASVNSKTPAEGDKYKQLITGWLGTGVSAERDSALLLSTAFKLGLKDA